MPAEPPNDSSSTSVSHIIHGTNDGNDFEQDQEWKDDPKETINAEIMIETPNKLSEIEKSTIFDSRRCEEETYATEFTEKSDLNRSTQVPAQDQKQSMNDAPQRKSAWTIGSIRRRTSFSQRALQERPAIASRKILSEYKDLTMELVNRPSPAIPHRHPGGVYRSFRRSSGWFAKDDRVPLFPPRIRTWKRKVKLEELMRLEPEGEDKAKDDENEEIKLRKVEERKKEISRRVVEIERRATEKKKENPTRAEEVERRAKEQSEKEAARREEEERLEAETRLRIGFWYFEAEPSRTERQAAEHKRKVHKLEVARLKEEEEQLQQEAEGKLEEMRRKEEEMARMEEGARRWEEVVVRRAQEAQRTLEEVKRNEEEVARLEEKIKRKEPEEQEARRLLAESLRRGEEAARRAEEERVEPERLCKEEDFKKKEAESKKKEQEAKCKVEAAQKLEMETSKKAEEAKKKEADLKKEEEQTRKREEKLKAEAEQTKRLQVEVKKAAEEAEEKQEKLQRLEEKTRKCEEEIRERELALFAREEELKALQRRTRPVAAVPNSWLSKEHQQELVELPASNTPVPQSINLEPSFTVSLSNVKTVDLTGHIVRDSEYPAHGGGYADVYKGLLRIEAETEIKVAVKVIRAHIYAPAHQAKIDKRLRREIRLWASLRRHPNIVPLLGTTTSFGSYTAMVCPWMSEGNLNHYLNERKSELDLRKRLLILEDVVEGLSYLHSQPVIHGDLTTGNILMDGGKAHLSDFGLSNVMADVRNNSFLTSTVGGAPRWTAPELLHSGTGDEVVPGVTKHSDIYSFGSVALQVISGRIPYENSSDFQVIMAVMNGTMPPRPPEPLLSDIFWDFIVLCWSRDPSARPDIVIVRKKLQLIQDCCSKEALAANVVDVDEVSQILVDYTPD